MASTTYTKIELAYKAGLSDLTSEITAWIKNAKDKEEVKETFASAQKAELNLDYLLKPSFHDTMVGSRHGLTVYLTCKNKEDLYDRVSHSLDRLLSQGNFEQPPGDSPFDIKIKVNDDVAKLNKEWKVYANTGTELFDVSYIHVRNSENGMITLSVSDLMASKKGLGVSIFSAIWEKILLDRKRLGLELHDNNYFGLEIYKSDVSFDDIGGYADVKQRVLEDVLYPVSHPEVYEHIIKKTRKKGGSPLSNAILFYGPPGTGKTLMARAVAGSGKFTFMKFSLAALYNKYVGETVRRMKMIFEYVENYSKKNGNVVLFIDELDSTGSRSQGTDSASMESTRVINFLLEKLDGLNTNKEKVKYTVIGATNNIAGLDSGLVSRFSTAVYFPLPSKGDRRAVISLYAKQLSDEELSTFASATEGFSCRDLESATKHAERAFARDMIEKKTEKLIPDLGYYLSAVKRMRPNAGNSKSSSNVVYG
jgi:ATP-dependent 26S proteasome regulatory subunit